MKQIALILTLLLAAAGASAQEVFIGADFDTRFDNREHSDCNIDDSHTFFSMRLTPKAGVIWSEKNRLVVAVDLLQDFGDKEHKFLSKVDPQIYYQFNSKTAQAVAGIFPRSLLLARYDPFFLGSAYSFYNNRIQGLAAHYKSQTAPSSSSPSTGRECARTRRARSSASSRAANTRDAIGTAAMS